MVRLLEKLWGSRNRVPAAARSSSRAPRRLRVLTQPGSPAFGVGRSFRPQLESLEDRLTPATLDFVPVAHVAINPNPLPPSALVEFDPFLSGGGIMTEEIVVTKHITGVLSKQITVPPATAGTPGQTLSLEVFYNLTANEAGEIIMPTVLDGGVRGIRAMYSMAGTMTEILAPMTPTTGGTWVFNGTMSEQGTFMGAISPADPATGMQTLTGQWQYSDFALETGVASGITQNTWAEYRAGISTGNLIETLTPGTSSMPPSAAATFWQQDQVTECLMPVIPFHPPNPCITINAVFNTAGSVFLGRSDGFLQQVDTGTTQYIDSLTETILMPDGSTQTLSQTSMDMGIFVNVVFPISTCPSC